MRVLVIGLSMLLTTACATINEPKLRFGEKQSDAAILSGTPQVFARETLINDRRREVEVIEALLTRSTEENFDADLSRQAEMRRALTVDFGLGIDTGVASQATREEELARRRHAIALRELDIEEAQLRARATDMGSVPLGSSPNRGPAPPAEEETSADTADAAGTTDDATPAPGSGETLPAAEAPTPESTAALTQWLSSTLTRQGTQLDSFSDLGAVPTRGNPLNRFRDLQAYRDALRAARNEALLDDGHDDGGLALYRLRMPATVLPGKHQDRLAVLRYRIDEGNDDVNAVELYRAWLGHVTQRLNAAVADGRSDQLADNSLEFVGAASNLFSPISFFLSEERVREADAAKSAIDAVMDPCFNIADPGLAWHKNCARIVLAFPPAIARSSAGVFPRMEHVRVRFWQSLRNTDVVDVAAQDTFTEAVRSLEGAPECGTGRRLWLRALVAAVDQLEQDDRARLKLDLAVCGAPVTPRSRTAVEKNESALSFGTATTLSNNTARPRTTYNVALTSLLRQLDDAPEERDRTKASKLEPNALSTVSCAGGTEEESEQCVLKASYALLQRADSNLSAFARQRLFTAREVERLNGEMTAFVAVMTPLVHGLSLRGGLKEGTRSLADSLLQSVTGAVQASRAACEMVATDTRLPVDCDNSKIWDSSSRGWKTVSLRESTHERVPAQVMVDLLRNSSARPKIYSISPTELAQRVTTVSQAAESIQLAAAASQVVPTAGRSAKLGVGFAQESAVRAQAMERNPLVAGFSEIYDLERTGCEAQQDCSRTGFGWVFGPHMRINPGRLQDSVVYDFRPANFELTADLAVPSWWRTLKLHKCAAWVDNWISNRHALNGDSLAAQCTEDTVTVRLPFGRADLDAMTRQIAASFGAGVATTRITAVSPANLRLCGEKVNLTIRGVDLWRSPQVTLAGVAAETGSVVVLPDMEGISASFASAKLKNATGPNEKAELVVVSQSGFDRIPLHVQRVVSSTGGLDWCQKAGETEKPKLEVFPAELPRCGGTLEFALNLAAPPKLSDGKTCVKGLHTQIANVNATVLSCSADSRIVLARAIIDAKGLRGRNVVPVVVTTDESIATQINVVGNDDDCRSDKPAPRKPTVTAVRANGQPGELLACPSAVRVTVDGTGLTAITGVELIGTKGKITSKPESGTTLEVNFEKLPGVPTGTTMPSSTQKLRLFYGEHGASVDTALQWKSCPT